VAAQHGDEAERDREAEREDACDAAQKTVKIAINPYRSA
jgi:hypothetical protein